MPPFQSSLRVDRRFPLVPLVLMLVAAACGGDAVGSPTIVPSSIGIVSGNGQVGLIGTALSVPLVVKVTASGAPVSGASVAFAVTSGTAAVSPATVTTDATGQAKTTLTFGSSPGNVAVTASVGGTSLSVAFVETAGTSVLTQACQSGAATTPAAGAVVAGVAGTGICLGGGTSGAEYALVAFNGNTDPSVTVAINVQSHGGVTGVSSASSATPASSAAPSGQSLMGPDLGALQSRYDAQLRASARRDLAPLMSSARTLVSRSAAFSAIPGSPAVGTLFTLNANGNLGQSCTNAINIVSRVAAVSNLAIVMADTANPSGGFTDAEYASFAATFDTLVSPLDISTFGAPSDIDKNGKTIIFFTKEVNRLTTRGSGGVIGGFFHERDLFPTTSTADLQACATSNFAEMYYSMVPDPTGRFSDARTKAYVQKLTPGTLAHEFQHLINAGRRLYVNKADDFEEVWLNEGLSHIAEELLYYRVTRQTPRLNIGTATIRGSSALVDAFNDYQGDNLGRFQLFINAAPQASPYADNDELFTRGATWSLLRYLADHRGSSDGDAWLQLDNTKAIGQQNLANVFASDKKITTLTTQIRDWSTSVFSDDLAGVTDARFLEPSWNWRDIFPELVNPSGQKLGKYPLNVIPLSDVQPANASIFAGGSAYVRFNVPAGASGSIDWTSGGLQVTPLVQFTVVRSK